MDFNDLLRIVLIGFILLLLVIACLIVPFTTGH